MSLKKNIIASYASQIYTSALGILALPLYIQYMGAEAYGLIGFFAILQASFNILDIGLTPTISRETAKFRAGGYDVLRYRQLFRALNLIFFSIASIGGAVLFFLSEYIGNHWLNVKHLSIIEVSFALQVMAISVALRWMTGLYRGVLSGSELLVWLSQFNSFIATLRFLIVIPVMWHFGATPRVFFIFQLLVAIIEYSGLLFKSRSLLPKLDTLQNIGWSIKPIKSVLRFSLSIGLTSGIWVIVTQTDKLIMSKLLTLEEYGYFTLGVLIASSIAMISGPISSSIMPRMAKLYEEDKKNELITLYQKSTQLVTVIVGSITIILAGFSKVILYLWTGDKNIAEIAAPVMMLYAIGYGVAAIASLPYCLQFAVGKIHLHVIGSILYVLFLLPILFWGTKQYGMIGAGYAWVIVNIVYFLVYIPIVHNITIPRLHITWLLKDIISIIIPSTLMYILLSPFNEDSMSLFKLTIFSILIIITSLVSSSMFRQHIVTLKGLSK